MTRFQSSFAAIVLVQAAHSVEEYVGHLWESFPPAQFLTGLVSHDREVGFIVINTSLLAFGCWCSMWPMRYDWRSAKYLAWFWIALQIINGIGHPLWSLGQGEYTPGVITAPILLVIALHLARQLLSMKNVSSQQPDRPSKMTESPEYEIRGQEKQDVSAT